MVIMPSAESLHTFVTNLLTSLGDEKIWLNDNILSFLDNVPKKSVVMEIKISKLQSQVSVVVGCNDQAYYFLSIPIL